MSRAPNLQLYPFRGVRTKQSSEQNLKLLINNCISSGVAGSREMSLAPNKQLKLLRGVSRSLRDVFGS